MFEHVKVFKVYVRHFKILNMFRNHTFHCLEHHSFSVIIGGPKALVIVAFQDIVQDTLHGMEPSNLAPSACHWDAHSHF